MNLRPSGYEPDELPGCSTPRRGRRAVGGWRLAVGRKSLATANADWRLPTTLERCRRTSKEADGSRRGKRTFLAGLAATYSPVS